MLRKLGKVLGIVVATYLLVMGLLLTIILIAYAPVIDRMLRPCAYYPNAFIDCKKEA